MTFRSRLGQGQAEKIDNESRNLQNNLELNEQTHTTMIFGKMQDVDVKIYFDLKPSLSSRSRHFEDAKLMLM